MLVIGVPLVTSVGVGEGELGSSPQPASTRERTRAVRASNRAMRGLLNEMIREPVVGMPDPDRHRGCPASYCEWRAVREWLRTGLAAVREGLRFESRGTVGFRDRTRD